MLKKYTAIRNIAILVVAVAYAVFIYLHEQHIEERAQELVNQHSRVIANQLWNLNIEGAGEYLRLAMATHQYTSLAVYDHGNIVFQVDSSTQPAAVDLFLRSLGLIPQRSYSSIISYNGDPIGRIVTQYSPSTIYIYINILFVLVILLITLHLYLRTVMDKGILEDRVKERTNELAESNVTLLKEIHEKKITASVLAKSEERFKNLYEESKNAKEVYLSLIESSADAIIIYDLEGQVQFLSNTFTEMFGYTFETVVGKQLAISPPNLPKGAEDIFQDILSNNSHYQGHETVGFTIDGKELDISISGSRFNDHTGNATGILFVVRDISERKHLEQQLQRSERLEAVGTLAGGIAHDFNNLLMGIQGNVSLAMVELPADSPLQERLKAIEQYVKNSEQLTSQLLGFARGGRYEVQLTDPNNLLSEESRLFARTRKDITLNRELAADIWPVEVDRGQLRQVMLNLFVNAGQAMVDGGTLQLTTGNVYLDKERADLYGIARGKYVQIDIADSGEGISREHLSRIFDPFFTTKEIGRGTGLGLASAYGIMQNHKGHIDVKSEVGKGTIFTLLLPASDKMLASQQAVNHEHSVLQGQGKILLVDDEKMILEVTGEILESLGYEVLTANSGAMACSLYKTNHDQITAVILDIVMPDMDGGQVYSILREINPKVKVLLSSGYSIDGKATRILNQGCSGFIQKPFNIESLADKLKTII